MAKRSKYDLALTNIDARLGALRDITNFIESASDPSAALIAANEQITALQSAKTLLVSAGETAPAANDAPKPRKARTKKPKAAQEEK